MKLHNRIIESLTRNNIYTVDQKGSYFQLKTVPRQREISIKTIEPQTMNGLEIQMSLTGFCIFQDAESNQQCNYIPGLVSDRNSLDPNFFVPTRVFQTSEVGEVISEETLEEIKKPGFQRGTNTQEIGIDFDFPNIGAFPGNNQSETTEIQRREENNYTIAGTFSRIRQIVKANEKEAVIGQTIRGFTILIDDENPWTNGIVQAGAQFLPDIIPQLEGSENAVNTQINRNLFLAANNTRLPSNSLTIYAAGIGKAESLSPEITNLNQIPRANYNSIWLGLSPVIKRQFKFFSAHLFHHLQNILNPVKLSRV